MDESGGRAASAWGMGRRGTKAKEEGRNNNYGGERDHNEIVLNRLLMWLWITKRLATIVANSLVTMDIPGSGRRERSS